MLFLWIVPLLLGMVSLAFNVHGDSRVYTFISIVAFTLSILGFVTELIQYV